LAPEAQLQVAVHALPLAAFPGGSTTKYMLTKASNGLTTDVVALPSPPSALTSKAPSTAWCVHGTLMVRTWYIDTPHNGFLPYFSFIFSGFSPNFHNLRVIRALASGTLRKRHSIEAAPSFPQ
jgi:hypothetical protein